MAYVHAAGHIRLDIFAVVRKIRLTILFLCQEEQSHKQDRLYPKEKAGQGICGWTDPL
jgi:hypothetical protein